MSEEYIKTSKACVYVLGCEANTASLYDFDGVYVLEGGFEEKSVGFVGNVRNVEAVLLSAPTKANLGTVSALIEHNQFTPLFTNVQQLKTVKPDTSAETLKKIQETSSKLLPIKPPVFNAKYEPYDLYKSHCKGHLSLYVLAGDAKDSEAISKALASGNEKEVAKAAADHGMVGVLLWRPAEADQPCVRVLMSGTCSMARIQQSLDKAARALPFLNKAVVKSSEALTDIPAPKMFGSATGAPAKRRPSPAGSASSRPNSSLPARPTSNRPTPTSSATRPATSRPMVARTTAAPTAPAAPRTRPAPSAAPTAPARRTAPTSTAPAKPATARGTEAPIQKKVVGKVQGAAPSKTAAAPAKKPAAPVAKGGKTAAAAPVTKKTTNAVVAPPPKAPEVQVVDTDAPNLDDSVLIIEEKSNVNGHSDSPSLDIVIVPPTPEPPRDETPKVDDVEPEIPPPIDAFKDPTPVKHDEPKPSPNGEHPNIDWPVSPVMPDSPVPAAPSDKVDDQPVPSPKADDHPVPSSPKFDDNPVPLSPKTDDHPVPLSPKTDDHPEPSAPPTSLLDDPHVIVPQPDGHPDIIAAVPFEPFVPPSDDGMLINLDGDDGKAPGFEEPLIPQAAREDGKLADCGEDVTELKKISMDTDKDDKIDDIANNTCSTTVIGEVTQLSKDLANLDLDSSVEHEYARKLSAQMIQEATLPFTSAFASGIVEKSDVVEKVEKVDETVPQVTEAEKHLPEVEKHWEGNNGSGVEEVAKHDLMQSRSSIIEDDVPKTYEKTDPALDGILDACANESEKLDSFVQNGATNGGPVERLYIQDKAAVVHKGPKFARPYYFDVVTAPRNEALETTANEHDLMEFATKIRSKNTILCTKDISTPQLEAVLAGKKLWLSPSNTTNVIPTTSTPNVNDFKHKNEGEFGNAFMKFLNPVDKTRINVTSGDTNKSYELVRIALRDE